MQRCSKCNSKFSYKELMISYWSQFNSENLECKKCKAKYKLSKGSRITVALLVTLPINFGRYLGLKGYLIYIAVLILAIPLINKYDLVNNDE